MKTTIIHKLLNFASLGITSLVISSCDQKSMDKPDYQLELYNAQVYTECPPQKDCVSPPMIYLKFRVENNTDNYTYFATKQDRFDNRNFSRFMLIDTLSKKMVYIYSGSRSIIKPDAIQEIWGEINIKEFKEYFDLDESFFNKENFNENKKLLFDKANNMLKHSVIFYNQDPKDVKSFLMINPEKLPIKPMGEDIVLKAKNNNVKAKEYTSEPKSGKITEIKSLVK